MNKPVRYTLAVLACVGCYLICVGLMVLTGIGGVLAAMITCFFIKKVWNGIVHYGEESDDKGDIIDATDEQHVNESHNHETEHTSGAAD